MGGQGRAHGAQGRIEDLGRGQWPLPGSSGPLECRHGARKREVRLGTVKTPGQLQRGSAWEAGGRQDMQADRDCAVDPGRARQSGVKSLE